MYAAVQLVIVFTLLLQLLLPNDIGLSVRKGWVCGGVVRWCDGMVVRWRISLVRRESGGMWVGVGSGW